MAVGTVSGVDPADNWQLVASQAMSGLNTYTFSSLSGYKTYWLVGKSLTHTTTDIVAIRVNGDTSGGAYANDWAIQNAGASAGQFIVTPTQTVVHAFSFEIDNADKSAPHHVKSTGYGTVSPGDAYTDPVAITSLTVKAYSNNNFTGGTVYLYGIAS